MHAAARIQPLALRYVDIQGERSRDAAWVGCPLEYRAFPRCRLPLERLDASRQAELPPLVKGYLNVGAWICGEPAWDPDFNVADLLILLPLANIRVRYAQHFLAKAA